MLELMSISLVLAAAGTGSCIVGLLVLVAVFILYLAETIACKVFHFINEVIGGGGPTVTASCAA